MHFNVDSESDSQTFFPLEVLCCIMQYFIMKAFRSIVCVTLTDSRSVPCYLCTFLSFTFETNSFGPENKSKKLIYLKELIKKKNCEEKMKENLGFYRALFEQVIINTWYVIITGTAEVLTAVSSMLLFPLALYFICLSSACFHL